MVTEELDREFLNAGFPPLPRNEASYLQDDFNFKKSIITPMEPIEYLKDDLGNLIRVPVYTSTMALGNLSSKEVSAERDDWRIARICKRYGYSNIIIDQYYAITDRVIATQAHQATMLAAVTVQQYGMRRTESLEQREKGTEDESAPLAGIISAIKGAPAKGNEMAQKRDDTTSRYRV